MTEAPLDTYIKSPPPADERSHFNYLEEQFTKLENVSKKHVVRIADNNQTAQSLVLQESEARSSADEAQATYTDTVAASVLSQAQAAISTEATARATADSALASQITSLTATVGTNTASITSEASVRATADTALGTRIDNLVLTNGSSAAVIIDEEATARIAADYALGTRIDSLTTTVNSNTAAISTEQTTRSTKDDALAQQLFTMSSGSSRVYIATSAPSSTGRQAGDVWFDSDDGYKPYVWARSTPTATSGTYDWRDNSGGSFTNLVGNYAAYSQAISTLNTTTSSQASSITSLQTTVGNSSSGLVKDVSALTTTVGDSTSGLVRDLNVLSTTVTNSNNSLSASISSEATARANADTALGSRIDTVTATVNGNTASIGTLQTVTANTSGALSTQWALVGSLGGPSNNILSITGARLADGTTLPYQVNFSNTNVSIDGNLVVSGSINGSKIVDGAIGAAQIASGAVGTAKIASGAVGSTQIAASGVVTSNITDNAVTNSVFASGTGSQTVTITVRPGARVQIFGYKESGSYETSQTWNSTQTAPTTNSNAFVKGTMTLTTPSGSSTFSILSFLSAQRDDTGAITWDGTKFIYYYNRVWTWVTSAVTGLSFYRNTGSTSVDITVTVTPSSGLPSSTVGLYVTELAK